MLKIFDGRSMRFEMGETLMNKTGTRFREISEAEVIYCSDKKCE